jgi:hypothetical protein
MAADWIRDPESAKRIEERTRRSATSTYLTEPAAKLLEYYEYRKDEKLTCARCGWSGQAGEAPGELHRELFDVCCPVCDKMLLVVSHPTIEQTKAAAAAGNPEAMAKLPQVAQIEARAARAESLELKPDSDLPQLGDEELEFTWDFEQKDDESWAVIRYSNQIIWHELAYWEGWERFNRVKDILKERYGQRFRSLKPTAGAEMYLYGDDLSASSKLETS